MFAERCGYLAALLVAGAGTLGLLVTVLDVESPAPGERVDLMELEVQRVVLELDVQRAVREQPVRHTCVCILPPGCMEHPLAKGCP